MLKRLWYALFGPPRATVADAPAPTREDSYLKLIETLARASAERFAAQLAHDDKVEELNLKKHELEVANAAALAEARAIERKSKEELRERKREAANAWNGANRKTQTHLNKCEVCKDPGSPRLTSAMIAWHHNGHNGEPPLALN